LPASACRNPHRACAESPPDGYTICFLSNQGLIANEFLYKHEKGDAIRKMVPASTLNSIVGELIKTGVEPDRDKDGIEANTYAYTSFTKE